MKMVSPSLLPELVSEAVQADGLKVLIISDAQSERNGVGSYYHDLVELLRDHVTSVELVSPGIDGAALKLSFPLIGDATQRLSLSNFLHIAS